MADGYKITMNSLARTILIVVIILILVGSLPTWGYSSGWGYYPSGGLGLVLIVLVILLLLGKL
jgi:hypothetical protein